MVGEVGVEVTETVKKRKGGQGKGWLALECSWCTQCLRRHIWVNKALTKGCLARAKGPAPHDIPLVIIMHLPLAELPGNKLKWPPLT